jgi:hypothetical protein
MVVYRDGGTRYAFEIPKFRSGHSAS